MIREIRAQLVRGMVAGTALEEFLNGSTLHLLDEEPIVAKTCGGRQFIECQLFKRHSSENVSVAEYPDFKVVVAARQLVSLSRYLMLVLSLARMNL